jgi:hypothetical protein
MSEPERPDAISVSEQRFGFFDRHLGVFVISLFVWLFGGSGMMLCGKGIVCVLGYAVIIFGICFYIYLAYFSSRSQSHQRRGQEKGLKS